jgi:hypothetical protein
LTLAACSATRIVTVFVIAGKTKPFGFTGTNDAFGVK